MNLERRFRVPRRGFRLAECDPGDTAGLTKATAKSLVEQDLVKLADLQDRLNAERRRALLVIAQGVDASGKDGTIRHVMSGMNPQGVSVTSFKEPSATELAHDFLWRAQIAAPALGEIGVFNRSHYEEVLVVRVHPELLAHEAIDPARGEDPRFWKQRFADIAAWERHLTRSGTKVLKFFLNISRAEQRKRFLERVERPEKQWKFVASDLREHRYWADYHRAYEQALAATSTAREPWYVIPADHKWFMRAAVATIVVHHLERIDPRYPRPAPEQQAELQAALEELRAEA